MQKEVLPQVERLYHHDWELTRALLRKASTLDLLRLEIPEQYGGLGLDLISASYVGEQIAVNPSFGGSLGAHTSIGTLPLVYFGSDEQKARYLPRLASADLVGAYALTETVTLFGYGFEMGGPLQMSLGWPLVSLFSLLVAMSMLVWALTLRGRARTLVSAISLARAERQEMGRARVVTRPMGPALPNMHDDGRNSPPAAISPDVASDTAATITTTPFGLSGGR
jgi:hypothetical protein